ncbi:MAG: hypothetical protein LBK76_06135 [Verrucomicrobiales bacterium]|jgi:hypothetical protein|nr:hypothetical protein [Verrucomicrobiales bacterium]
MNKLNMKRFLPAGALGMSLLLHLGVFLTISGMVLIEAVKPKIVPSGEVNVGAPTDALPPPELPPEELPETPADDERADNHPADIPQMPSVSVEQIASAVTSSGLPNALYVPAVSVGAAPQTAEPDATREPAAERKTAQAVRRMSNPFGDAVSPDATGVLVGYLYDLKKKADGTPSELAGNIGVDYHLQDQTEDGAQKKCVEFVGKYIERGWDDKLLAGYYKVEKPLGAYQIYLPNMFATEGPKAFRVEKLVQPRRWIVVYRGAFTSNVSGTFRFVAPTASQFLVVRLNTKNVFDSSVRPMVTPSPITETYYGVQQRKGARGPTDWLNYSYEGERAGVWFRLETGQTYNLSVLVGTFSGGYCSACLMIEEKGATHETFSLQKLLVAHIARGENLKKQMKPGELESLQAQRKNGTLKTGGMVNGVWQYTKEAVQLGEMEGLERNKLILSEIERKKRPGDVPVLPLFQLAPVSLGKGIEELAIGHPVMAKKPFVVQ